MTDNKYRPAKITKKNIIDSYGHHIPFSSPRITHVWPIDTSYYLSRLAKSFFEKRGFNFRICGKTDSAVLQAARYITSGKECLPMNAIAGSIYTDLCTRDDDEISLYYSPNNGGPCQIGAWPLIFDTFTEKNKIRNAIFCMSLNEKHNYFGKGLGFLKDFTSIFYISDMIEEAKSALKCVAKDRMDALKIFDEVTEEVINSAKINHSALIKSLRNWNNKLSKIPRKCKLKDVPKILIFGGLNILFDHHPVTKYFENQSIIVKQIDITEGIISMQCEELYKYCISNNILDPENQFKYMHYFISLFQNSIKNILCSKPKSNNALKAAEARLSITYLEFIIKKYRKFLGQSGLLFDEYISFKDLAIEGHKYITNNAMTESSITVGRYLNTIKNSVFDGMINLGTFNCQPAMNSAAVLRSIVNMND
ncbi:MAG TPA: hypothetical protein QF753_06080, partial [Victivallales bacterium]|nr:hypothetical protein [Victivallales bacterium]